MEKNNLIEINKNRIVLTNLEIFNLISPTPVKVSFDKLQSISNVSGKLEYWIYRFWKKVIEFYKDIEEVRISLAKKFCEKNVDGSLRFIDSTYQFEPEQKKLYDTEVEVGAYSEEDKKNAIEKIALKFCKRDEEGNPIKTGGTNLLFNKDGMEKFNLTFNELLEVENVFPIDKIRINSELLEKINCGEKRLELMT